MRSSQPPFWETSRHFAPDIIRKILAEGVRQRTQIPLFAFWLPFNAAASAKIKENLSRAELDAITAEARAAREEDGVNEALAALSRFAEG